MWAALPFNDAQTSFSDLDKGYPFVDGSTNSTVSEIGGTSNRVITVGAYNSKNTWSALNGNVLTTTQIEGTLAFFSSKGPTEDGRIKPDITAPGNVIVSSVSRFDEMFSAGSDHVI